MSDCLVAYNFVIMFIKTMELIIKLMEFKQLIIFHGNCENKIILDF